MVAIGPYHHDRGHHLKQAEKVKHVAAYHCIRESGLSVQEIYDAVVSVADYARRLYDKDVMEGISDGDFLPMMFFDACFLVQYMLWYTDVSDEIVDPSLRSFFYSNRKDIHRDVMLLENQLPWRVVETVLRFRPVPLEDFIAPWKYCLQDRKVLKEKPFTLNDSYEPPHLLGLLRFYIVGRGNSKLPPLDKMDSISVSVSAIELAEIGIMLTANEPAELIHMGVDKKGILFAQLSLTPLSLDDTRASLLLNMAALELCTTTDFLEAEEEDSAVCSYLLLLAMLVHREEDVHELRTKHLLQGGAGFINKDALDFFRNFQSLPHGYSYARVMVEIENYKVNRRMRIKVLAFVYKNRKTIITFFTAVGALVGILSTLKSLKVH